MSDYARAVGTSVHAAIGVAASYAVHEPGRFGTDTYVVGIVGQRGSGKTTLMRQVLADRSLDPDSVVLTVIEPEFFGVNDTVLGHFIASLRNVLYGRLDGSMKTAVELPPELGGQTTLGGLLERLLRDSYQIGGSGQIPTSSLDQQRNDFARIMTFGESFRTALRIGVEESLRAVGGGTVPINATVLVAVDDPDLRPELFATVLQHLRLLAGTPRVVVLGCYSPDQAQEALSSNLLRQGASSIGVAAASAKLHLLKTFPPFLECRLNELSISQRLDFAPTGQGPTLGELLERVPSPSFNVKGAATLLDLMWPGRLPDPKSSFLSALPSLPRELVALYFSLARVSERDEVREHFTAAIQLLIESGLSATRTTASNSTVHDPARVRWDESLAVPGLEVSTDFRDINLSTISTPVKVQFAMPKGARIRFAYYRGLSGRFESSQAQSDIGLIDTLLLVREVAHVWDELDEDVQGGAPVFGGRGKSTQRIFIDGVGSDAEFLVIPAWESYGDVFLWNHEMKRLFKIFEEYSAGRSPDSTAIPIAALAFHLELVCNLLRRDSVSSRTDEFLLNCLANPESSAVDFLADALALLVATAAGLKSNGANGRESDFISWIALSVPSALHPAIIPADWCREVMSSWYRALAKHPGDHVSNLRSSLDRRIRKSLGEPWVSGLIELAELEILPAADVLRWRAMHEAAIAQRGRLDDAQKDAIKVSVPPESTSEFIPREPSLVQEVLRAMLAQESSISG